MNEVDEEPQNIKDCRMMIKNMLDIFKVDLVAYDVAHPNMIPTPALRQREDEERKLYDVYGKDS